MAWQRRGGYSGEARPPMTSEVHTTGEKKKKKEKNGGIEPLLGAE